MEKTCNSCEFCFMHDHGYSNWTTEGTNVYCMLDLHPSGKEGFDNWYGEDARTLFAEQCEGYAQGEPVHFDVDNEDDNHSIERRIKDGEITAAQVLAWNNWENRKYVY